MSTGFDENVDYSESRQAMAHAVAWVFTGIAVVAVILKLFTRVDRFHKLGWDDFFIVFSTVCAEEFSHCSKMDDGWLNRRIDH